MNTTTRAGKRMRLELGWPVPVLGAMCVVLAAMPAGTVLPTMSGLTVLLVAMGNALYRRRPPQVIVATSLTAAAASAVATFGHGGPVGQELAAWLLLETALLLCVLVQAVRNVPGVHGLLSGGTVASAVVLAPLRLTFGARASPWTGKVTEWCLCWGVLAACAVAIGLYLRSLDEARQRSVHAARREQRVQLARDLHDWLAHELTGLVLEAQAARLPDRAAADVVRALEHIEEAGVRVLDSVDRALSWLRNGGDAGDAAEGERLPTMVDLPGLVSRFDALGPISVRLELDDRATSVRPEIAGTAYRVVLEALTNVRRHAPTARHVSVDVHRNGAHLIVRVANDGARRQGLLRRSRSGGTGLRDLAERVAALGGTSWAGPAGPAGWAVHVVLPVVS